MAQDTRLKDFIINLLDKEQFDGIAQLNKNEMYLVEGDDSFARKTVDFVSNLTADNKGITEKELRDVQQSSFRFKGYVSVEQPSSTLGLKEDDIWINSATLPTSFPVLASQIRVWDGTSWTTTADEYTANALDAIQNINDDNGYYWFGGQWKILTVAMSTDDFVRGIDSKWLIKDDVMLRGEPQVENEPTEPMGIANKRMVDILNEVSDENNLVHKNGVEVIKGNKTFTGDTIINKSAPTLIFKDSSVTKGNAPGITSASGISFVDQNNEQMGSISGEYATNGDYSVVAKANDAELRVVSSQAGNYCKFPTAPADANGDVGVTVDWLNNQGIMNLMPTGAILPYAGETAPTGWSLCDGGTLSRIGDARLFAVIGTKYGAGNGSTTFNKPNLINRTLWGTTVANRGVTSNGELPNITGTLYARGIQVSVLNSGDTPITPTTGVFRGTGTAIKAGGQSGEGRWCGYMDNTTFDASRSSSVYGNYTAVKPSSVGVQFIIKL